MSNLIRLYQRFVLTPYDRAKAPAAPPPMTPEEREGRKVFCPERVPARGAAMSRKMTRAEVRALIDVILKGEFAPDLLPEVIAKVLVALIYYC
jgi:hypothetical protein